jgi:hypothetical protein
MASQPSSIVNPATQSRYSLQVSEELLDRENTSATYSTVKLNHKPSQTGSRKTKITSSGLDSFSLDITDKEDGKTSAYHYGGQRKRPKKSYVLVFDPENQSCVLKPLSESYTFNLESTPWQQSTEILTGEYAQIQSETPSEHDDAELPESYSDAEIDEGNPFDYRHHLNKLGNKSSSPSPGHLVPPKPSVGSNNGARDRSISAPEPPNRARKAPPPKQRPTPAVRLERRASTRGIQKSTGKSTAKKGGNGPKSQEFISVSDDEDMSPKPTPAPSDIEEQDEDDYGDLNNAGGLEIDFGNSPPHSQRQRALTLPGSAKGGPISLRSAANSPSSQINTPQRHRDDTDGLVIDLGDHGDYDDDAEMSDAEGDIDVEPISLGSPAHAKSDGHSNGVDLDVDMDDFEAEMMQGLASQDDDNVAFGQSRAQESESESEAE